MLRVIGGKLYGLGGIGYKPRFRSIKPISDADFVSEKERHFSTPSNVPQHIAQAVTDHYSEELPAGQRSPEQVTQYCNACNAAEVDTVAATLDHLVDTNRRTADYTSSVKVLSTTLEHTSGVKDDAYYSILASEAQNIVINRRISRVAQAKANVENYVSVNPYCSSGVVDVAADNIINFESAVDDENQPYFDDQTKAKLRAYWGAVQNGEPSAPELLAHALDGSALDGLIRNNSDKDALDGFVRLNLDYQETLRTNPLGITERFVAHEIASRGDFQAAVSLNDEVAAAEIFGEVVGGIQNVKSFLDSGMPNQDYFDEANAEASIPGKRACVDPDGRPVTMYYFGGTSPINPNLRNKPTVISGIREQEMSESVARRVAAVISHTLAKAAANATSQDYKVPVEYAREVDSLLKDSLFCNCIVASSGDYRVVYQQVAFGIAYEVCTSGSSSLPLLSGRIDDISNAVRGTDINYSALLIQEVEKALLACASADFASVPSVYRDAVVDIKTARGNAKKWAALIVYRSGRVSLKDVPDLEETVGDVSSRIDASLEKKARYSHTRKIEDEFRKVIRTIYFLVYSPLPVHEIPAEYRTDVQHIRSTPDHDEARQLLFAYAKGKVSQVDEIGRLDEEEDRAAAAEASRIAAEAARQEAIRLAAQPPLGADRVSIGPKPVSVLALCAWEIFTNRSNTGTPVTRSMPILIDELADIDRALEGAKTTVAKGAAKEIDLLTESIHKFLKKELDEIMDSNATFPTEVTPKTIDLARSLEFAVSWAMGGAERFAGRVFSDADLARRVHFLSTRLTYDSDLRFASLARRGAAWDIEPTVTEVTLDHASLAVGRSVASAVTSNRPTNGIMSADNFRNTFRAVICAIPDEWVSAGMRSRDDLLELVDKTASSNWGDLIIYLNKSIFNPHGLAILSVFNARDIYVQGVSVYRLRSKMGIGGLTDIEALYVEPFSTAVPDVMGRSGGYFQTSSGMIFLRNEDNHKKSQGYAHERQHLFDYAAGFFSDVSVYAVAQAGSNAALERSVKDKFIERTAICREYAVALRKGMDLNAAASEIIAASKGAPPWNMAANDVGVVFAQALETAKDMPEGDRIPYVISCLENQIDETYKLITGARNPDGKVTFSELYSSNSSLSASDLVRVFAGQRPSPAEDGVTRTRTGRTDGSSTSTMRSASAPIPIDPVTVAPDPVSQAKPIHPHTGNYFRVELRPVGLDALRRATKLAAVSFSSSKQSKEVVQGVLKLAGISDAAESPTSEELNKFCLLDPGIRVVLVQRFITSKIADGHVLEVSTYRKAARDISESLGLISPTKEEVARAIITPYVASRYQKDLLYHRLGVPVGSVFDASSLASPLLTAYSPAELKHLAPVFGVIGESYPFAANKTYAEVIGSAKRVSVYNAELLAEAKKVDITLLRAAARDQYEARALYEMFSDTEYSAVRSKRTVGEDVNDFTSHDVYSYSRNGSSYALDMIISGNGGPGSSSAHDAREIAREIISLSLFSGWVEDLSKPSVDWMMKVVDLTLVGEQVKRKKTQDNTVEINMGVEFSMCVRNGANKAFFARAGRGSYQFLKFNHDTRMRISQKDPPAADPNSLGGNYNVLFYPTAGYGGGELIDLRKQDKYVLTLGNHRVTYEIKSH